MHDYFDAEVQVRGMMAEGMTTAEIAEETGMAVAMVRRYRKVVEGISDETACIMEDIRMNVPFNLSWILKSGFLDIGEENHRRFFGEIAKDYSRYETRRVKRDDMTAALCRVMGWEQRTTACKKAVAKDYHIVIELYGQEYKLPVYGEKMKFSNGNVRDPELTIHQIAEIIEMPEGELQAMIRGIRIGHRMRSRVARIPWDVKKPKKKRKKRLKRC